MDRRIGEALDRAATRGLRVDVAPIAVGGSSLIFLARDEAQRRVAVKVPRFGTRPASEDWLLTRAIHKEAQVLAHVDSPHLPSLVAVDADGHFLCRSYLPGVSLEAAASTATSAAERRARLAGLLRLAEAIFPLFHQAGEGAFAIRDFKPRNIVVCRDGSMVLVDVGSVRRERDMRSGRRRVLRVGTGKWRHWPPEQLTESGEDLDRRVDYFALGSAAGFVLAGRFPYGNRHPQAETLLAAYLAQYARTARELDRQATAIGVPPELREFLIACIHPEPRWRPTLPYPTSASSLVACDA